MNGSLNSASKLTSVLENSFPLTDHLPVKNSNGPLICSILIVLSVKIFFDLTE